jgi:hypothetical protein
MKRFQGRRGNGRFRRNTLENTFGLKAYVCASCRRFNPIALGEGRPTACNHCEATPFVDISDAPKEEST